MSQDPVVITAIARTPLGNLSGILKDMTAPALGAAVIHAVTQRAAIPVAELTEVIMGCVLPAGTGQAPARQAALQGGLPASIPCTTLNKVCGSGMKSIMFARQALLANGEGMIIAGGMESMSNAPYLLKGARQGFRLGGVKCEDHLMLDGLENAADGKPMGYFADLCAKDKKIDRHAQDAFATASVLRAREAIDRKLFVHEIIPVTITTREGEKTFSTDERPGSVNPEKIPLLKPVFMKDGTVTAGNASAISDGAAAVLLMHESRATAPGLTPLARIVGATTHAQSPETFTTAPVGAIEKLLQQTGWTADSVDLFEINEAFAVVTLATMQALKLPHEKVNVNGGACALGHPIGASGARIVVTLIAALHQRKAKRGIAALCIGGGEATAIALERI